MNTHQILYLNLDLFDLQDKYCFYKLHANKIDDNSTLVDANIIKIEKKKHEEAKNLYDRPFDAHN